MAKQNLITLQLLAISGILASILVSMIAYRRFVLPVGQADLTTVAADLTPPYLRLVPDQEASNEQVVAVNVFANTGGFPVNAVDLAINYNHEILELQEDGIIATDVFKVFSNQATVSGQINLSMFSSAERGENILHTNADLETRIAQLRFTVLRSDLPITNLEFVFRQNDLSETNMILDEGERQEFPSDILRTVNSLIVNLRQNPSL